MLTKYVRLITTNARVVDNIDAKSLKSVIPVVIPMILDIYHSSVNHSIYPSPCESALIQPIAKIPNAKEMSDYRPIALLCALSKPLECHVFNATVEHLIRNNLLDEFQSGFWKGYSTQTALLKITDDIRHSAEKCKITILVQLDCSKAFD
jgi:hypothetical protein